MFDSRFTESTMGLFIVYIPRPGRSSNRSIHMTRKSVVLALALLIVCIPAALAQSASAPAASLAPPEHPATEAQIREYLALTRALDTAHNAMAQSLKAARATSAPYFTPSFWDDMEKAIMDIDLVGPLLPAYQRYFSQEDMAATIAFYKSPAGSRLLAAQPFITAAASDAARKAGEVAGREVGLKHQEEIQKLMQQQSQPQMILPPNK
jgi:hypothetical protein